MKINKISTAIFLAVMLISTFSAAAQAPPELPSGFYGKIFLAGVNAGDLIEAFVDEQTVRVVFDVIKLIEGDLVYSLSVSAYPDGSYPETVILKINGQVVATAPWVKGTNVELNLGLMSINLVAGWNLISFPIKQISTDIRCVLASIQGEYDIVYAWDAGEKDEFKQWMSYNPASGFPFQSNTLTALDERMGFWINMRQSATLTLNGVYPSGVTQVPLKIAAGGWNMVGFPSINPVGLPGALEAKGVAYDDYTVVWRYEPLDDRDEWKLFNPAPGFPPNEQDFIALSPGWGYWIYVTTAEDLIWEVD